MLLALLLVLSLTLVKACEVVFDCRLYFVLVNGSACFLRLLALLLGLASEVFVVLTFTAFGLGRGLLLWLIDSLFLLSAARILFLVASLFLVLARAFLIILCRCIVIIISAIAVLLLLALIFILLPDLLFDSSFSLYPLVFVFRFRPASVAVCEHILYQDLNSQRDTVFRIFRVQGLQFTQTIVNFVHKVLQLGTLVFFLSLEDAAIQSDAELGYESDSGLTRVVINRGVGRLLDPQKRKEHRLHDLICHDTGLDKLAHEFNVPEQLVLLLDVALLTIFLRLVCLLLLSQRRLQQSLEGLSAILKHLFAEITLLDVVPRRLNSPNQHL